MSAEVENFHTTVAYIAGIIELMLHLHVVEDLLDDFQIMKIVSDHEHAAIRRETSNTDATNGAATVQVQCVARRRR